MNIIYIASAILVPSPWGYITGGGCVDILQRVVKQFYVLLKLGIYTLHWFTDLCGLSMYPSFRGVSLRMATRLAETCCRNATLV